MQKQPWTKRFVGITPRVMAQAAFVFIGEDAEKARDIPWPETHRHYEEPRSRGEKKFDATTKIYLFGVQSTNGPLEARFRFSELVAQMERLGAKEAYIEWTFMRRNARIACARASEDAVWGFGRPHPKKPNFKPHQDLAGPLVDYRPGMKDGWVFEPVIMKVLPTLGGDAHIMELAPKWVPEALVMAAGDPVVVPPQLAAVFSGVPF